MFDQTNKYPNQGHFFFNPGDNLQNKSSEVPDLPGVHYIMRLAGGSIDLVYIGSSGTVNQKGTLSNQSLREELNNKQEGIKRQQFFEKKIEAEKIDGLDIYWFVTFDENHQDLPGYVEGVLVQRYFEVYGTLPPWNKKFPS
ncbi:MAG: hypothetical protein WEA56_01475 [Balneolaceae bacterium]